MASPRMLADLEGSFRFAEAGIKMLIGINGAAAIGVLTFLGNLLTKDAEIELGLRSIAFALGAFAFGVGLAAAANIFAFLVQTERAADPGEGASDDGEHWRIAGLIAAVASLAAFVAGIAFSIAALPIW